MTTKSIAIYLAFKSPAISFTYLDGGSFFVPSLLVKERSTSTAGFFPVLHVSAFHDVGNSQTMAMFYCFVISMVQEILLPIEMTIDKICN